MKRLTERNKGGWAMAACCGKACEYNYCCETGGFSECKGMDDIIDRLAEIEDILGEEYDLDQMRELVEADKDGRCVVLPQDGMVYYIEQSGGEKWVANKPIQQIILKCGWGLASLNFSLFDANKYFTREAAESALNEAKLEKPGNNHFMNRFMEVK